MGLGMPNLAEVYDMLNDREKKKIIDYWNNHHPTKRIELATLPFLDAVLFKRLMYQITDAPNFRETNIKMEFKYEQNIKHVIYLATKDVKWEVWAFGDEIYPERTN